MRILMTADTVGGIWSHALELCRALAPHGAFVDLATMGAPPTAEQRRAAAALKNVRMHGSSWRLEWMDDPWDDVAAAADWLLDLAADVQPDVVHLNGFAHAALPWRAPVLVAAHSCVLSWWRAVRGADAPAEWARYAAVVRRGIAAADLVVAPTREMLVSCHAHYGVPRRGAVIPNGVNSAPAPAAKLPIVLAAGRLWDEAKNIATLDAAAPRVQWPVHVAGAATSPDGRATAPRHVELLGALTPEQMNAAYARASIFAHPAVYEPFGLAPLEAALHGCALVLGDIPSLREVWGDAASYVPPRDAGAVADAINRLAADDAALHLAGSRAVRRARMYTAARMAEGYMGAYRALQRELGIAREVAACVS